MEGFFAGIGALVTGEAGGPSAAPSAASAPATEISPPTPARDWACPKCTYLHTGEEAAFLQCSICGTTRVEVSQPVHEPTPSDDVAFASAAAILAASRAVDSALAARPNREAQVSSLIDLTDGSMASRIAQARQARQAMRAAASANAKINGSPSSSRSPARVEDRPRASLPDAPAGTAATIESSLQPEDSPNTSTDAAKVAI